MALKVAARFLANDALDRLTTVADQAAMFALTTATVQNGDFVRQTDTGAVYFVSDDSNLGNANGYVLIGLSISGDIALTSFLAANNQSSAANVTGFSFANGTVRSFTSLVSVSIVATASLYEVFQILGVQQSAGWTIIVTSTGSVSGVTFSITSAGQIQYTSTNVSGFTSSTIKFRASITSV